MRHPTEHTIATLQLTAGADTETARLFVADSTIRWAIPDDWRGGALRIRFWSTDPLDYVDLAVSPDPTATLNPAAVPDELNPIWRGPTLGRRLLPGEACRWVVPSGAAWSPAGAWLVACAALPKAAGAWLEVTPE